MMKILINCFLYKFKRKIPTSILFDFPCIFYSFIIEIKTLIKAYLIFYMSQNHIFIN